MRRFVLTFAAVFVLAGTTSAQEVTGLSGWNIYLDPGHSQNENVGVFGYSEARKVVRVGLALRELLLETTDIDTVYMSRTNDQQNVSLTQRSDHANQVGAAFFQSIHSDAGSPNVNSTLMLWGQYRDGREKIPNGGKRMGDNMVDDLTRAMRIGTRGSRGDCSFYGCTGEGPYLSVNRRTVMASNLSEAGFHTNPTQNQRNMNADWKRLEAQAMYWSILDFHGLLRPPVSIVTGIIRDSESGKPVNGAAITVADTSYVTDTYESLFRFYSNDPNELANGFYYLDRLPSGELPVRVEAAGFEPFEGSVTSVDTFLTFFDIALVSTAPPEVTASTPAQGDERFRLVDPILIAFSRPMDRESVEGAFSIDPEVDGTFGWTNNDTRLIFRPDSLSPETDYTVRITESARAAAGYAFDGDGDGEPGGIFELTFRSSPADVTAPVVVAGYPVPRQNNVRRDALLSYAFDEQIDEASISPGLFSLTTTTGGTPVPGAVSHQVVHEQSVIHFFPQALLAGDVSYTFTIEPGLRDLAGNVVETRRAIPFRTSTDVFEVTVIDPFEPSGEGVWWQPQQSGSTTGIVTDSTSFNVDSAVINLLSGSTQSRRLDYGWNVGSSSTLIREYLGGGAAREIWFDTTQTLQVYLFGDGSGNRFRFAIDDQAGHEVSPWINVDWLGWRLVSWDLSEGETGSWIGDGTLDQPLRFDSFQLSYAEGSPAFGSLWFDDLRLERLTTDTASEVADLPDRFVLHQNYPNPFNPSTTLRFTLPAASSVTVSIYSALGQMVEELTRDRALPPGTHEVTWNAAGHPSGVYFARVESGDLTRTVTLVLMK